MSDISNEALFYHLKNEWLPKRLNYVMNELHHDLGEVSMIHRSMALPQSQVDQIVKSIEKKEPVNVGRFWSIGANDTYGISGDHTNRVHVILGKHFDASEVNWVETIRSRMDYENGDDEREIQLHSDVTVVDVIDIDN